MTRRVLPSLVLLLATAACSVTAPIAPPKDQHNVNTAIGQAVGTTLQGVVLAPPGVIAAGGGNVIAAGGGNVIAAGGGNVIAAGGGNYRVRNVGGAPLAGATVYLGDAAGNRLADTPEVTTDANGRYTLRNVPVGITVQVMVAVKTVGGDDGSMASLANTSDTNPDLPVNYTSTCLTAALLHQVHGALGTMDQSAYSKAVTALDGMWSAASVGITDKSGMIAEVQQAANQNTSVQQLIDGLVASLNAGTAGAGPAPAPTPAPTATSEPTAAPTPTPMPSGAQVSTLLSASLAALKSPNAIAQAPDGTIFVLDTGNNRICTLAPNGTVTTFAGSPSGAAGSQDGTGTAAQFDHPLGMSLVHVGNNDYDLYVADTGNHVVRVVGSNGQVTTAKLQDLSGNVLQFKQPASVVLDASGNAWVADAGANQVFEFDKTFKLVGTLGSGQAGFTDGIDTAAAFHGPNGLCFDGAGNLYILDAGNNALREYHTGGASNGKVDTLPSAGSQPYANPGGVAVDQSGNIVVADTGHNALVLLSPGGSTPTHVGTGTAGELDGAAAQASLTGPTGVTIDSSGNVLFTESTGSARKLTH